MKNMAKKQIFGLRYLERTSDATTGQRVHYYMSQAICHVYGGGDGVDYVVDAYDDGIQSC